MSTVTRLTKRIIAIILVLVIAVALVAAVVYKTGMTPYHLYAVRTGSMGKTIPPESEVVVRDGQYHVGQVVSFRYAGEVITHRLIKLESGMATTKGDANPSADPWKVPQRDIIGGVVAAPRHAGWVLMYLTHSKRGDLGIVLLVIAAWLLLTFPEREEPQKPETPDTEFAHA
jgi:signal peptidase I